MTIRKSLRPKQAAELLGISLPTFWRWIKERHDFPRPKRLSARCTVLDGNELLAWRDAHEVSRLTREKSEIPAATGQTQDQSIGNGESVTAAQQQLQTTLIARSRAGD